MHDNHNASAAHAAGNFDVSELEKRHENLWTGVETGPIEPSGPDGQGPQPGNQ